MKSSINDSFRQAKASYGIITSLPFTPQNAVPRDNSERLRAILRSQESRDIHGREIEELLREKPELLPVYSEEMGRIQAKKYRKRLRDIGIKEGWFAIIEGIIIAGGLDQKKVEKIAESLLPVEKRNLVHIFHLEDK
jgi:3-methyladenine DNA glycosylase/8-oxoguanine DNA glycosylase